MLLGVGCYDWALQFFDSAAADGHNPEQAPAAYRAYGWLVADMCDLLLSAA